MDAIIVKKEDFDIIKKEIFKDMQNKKDKLFLAIPALNKICSSIITDKLAYNFR